MDTTCTRRNFDRQTHRPVRAERSERRHNRELVPSSARPLTTEGVTILPRCDDEYTTTASDIGANHWPSINDNLISLRLSVRGQMRLAFSHSASTARPPGFCLHATSMTNVFFLATPQACLITRPFGGSAGRSACGGACRCGQLSWQRPLALILI